MEKIYINSRRENIKCYNRKDSYGLKLLKCYNNINYSIDPLNNPRCILYKCLESVVRFKIHDDIITQNFTDKFLITKLYFDTYDKINFRNT